MSRYVIHWDADAQEWIVTDGLLRLAAFSRLHEAEHYVCSLADDQDEAS